MPDTKHSEFLQAAIARIAGYSFLAKGWSITLTAAALGLAAKDGKAVYVVIGLLPVGMFALLDAYYLAMERGFRRLFIEASRKIEAGEPADFNMDPGRVTALELLCAAVRPAVLWMHGPLLVALIVAWWIFKNGGAT